MFQATHLIGFGAKRAAASDPYPGGVSANLYCWLKSDTGLYTNTTKTTAVSTNGDLVAAWADQSGSGRDFTQATSGSRPTYQTSVLNGYPAVRFDGSDDNLSAASWSVSAAELFVVMKLDVDPPATQATTGCWSFGSTSTNTSGFPFTNGTIYDNTFTTVRKTTVNPTPSLSSTFRLYNVVSRSGEWTSFLDGTQLYTTATNTVGNSSTPLIGASSGSDGQFYFDGDMVEVIVYSAKLSSTDKSAVEAYIASRYGLTIA